MQPIGNVHSGGYLGTLWLLVCAVVDVIFPDFPPFFPLTWIGRVRLIPDNTKNFQLFCIVLA
jgi:hypothetical protein